MLTIDYLKHAVSTKHQLLFCIEPNEEGINEAIDALTKCTNIIFIGEDNKGIIFGMVSNYHLNTKIKVGTILVSYFEPNYHGLYSHKLVTRFIHECKKLKADFITLDDLGINPDVGRIYTKLGFKKLETHYYMEVNKCQQQQL